MLFSPFLSAISINGKDRLSEGNLMAISPQYQNHSKALNKCMWFYVHYLFIFIYLAKYCLFWHMLSVLLQPVLWQEKLWKQERDSIRPCDHWQVGSSSVFSNGEWVRVWPTKWMSDWVDELVNKWVPSQRARRLSWADLHLRCPQCGNCGWSCVSGWGASFPGTRAPRGGHHLDRVCSITGGSITRGSWWE